MALHEKSLSDFFSVNLCVLCASVVKESFEKNNPRDASEIAQRNQTFRAKPV